MRRQSVASLAAELMNHVDLREPPAIIAAPPSDVADYPRAAIWLERFVAEYSQVEELEVDEEGELLIGANAIIGVGAGAASIEPGVQLSVAGTLRGSGRIWVGCRLHPRREELEDEIRLAFLQDDNSPGRLMIPIANPKAGRYVLPWTWYAAAFINDSEWTNEFAFAERLWAWIQFDLEIPILVPRRDPLVTRFLLDLDADFRQPNLVTGQVDNSDGTADDVRIIYTVPLPE